MSPPPPSSKTNPPISNAAHDNGEGIAPKHVPRLAERFCHVDRGRSQASGGTGLGLAIVKHVLIRHGAHLDVRSSQDGERQGTQFSVLLPTERARAPEPKLQAVAAWWPVESFLAIARQRLIFHRRRCAKGCRPTYPPAPISRVIAAPKTPFAVEVPG